MMRVDDLVAAISSLQRSDLEAWVREELVVPRQEAGTLLFTDMNATDEAKDDALALPLLRLMVSMP
jgi:hypothetical protein